MCPQCKETWWDKSNRTEVKPKDVFDDIFLKGSNPSVLSSASTRLVHAMGESQKPNELEIQEYANFKVQEIDNHNEDEVLSPEVVDRTVILGSDHSFSLRPAQTPIFNDLLDFENDPTKSNCLLNAFCGTGKTCLSLYLVKHILEKSPESRIAVIAYSFKKIRNQWWKNNETNKIVDPTTIQVVVSSSEKDKEKNTHTVSMGNIDLNKKVTIFIPQTVKHKNLGSFTHIFIDEVHANFETKKQTLKNILASCSTPKTKIYGLTGTGFNLSGPGKFFDTSKPENTVIVYDLPYALQNDLVIDAKLIIPFIHLSFNRRSYKGDDLNKVGIQYFKDRVTHSDLLKKLILEVEGKTLVIVPPGCGSFIKHFLEKICPGKVRMNLWDMPENEIDKQEHEFKTDPNVKFLVVVYMAGVGWDFPELMNVLNLSCTKNTIRIIQNLSRLVRNYPGKKIPSYYHFADSIHQRASALFALEKAIEFTIKENIQNPDLWDKRVYINKRILHDPTDVSERSIELGSFTKYISYATNPEDYNHDKDSEEIHRSTLSELIERSFVKREPKHIEIKEKEIKKKPKNIHNILSLIPPKTRVMFDDISYALDIDKEEAIETVIHHYYVSKGILPRPSRARSMSENKV